MRAGELDPDVARWGLYDLVDVCAVSNSGSRRTITGFDVDLSGSNVERVTEGYCGGEVENDATIAHVLQEEFRRLASVEASGRCEGEGVSVVDQDWPGGGFERPRVSDGNGSNDQSVEGVDDCGIRIMGEDCGSSDGKGDEVGQMGTCSSSSSPAEDSVNGDGLLHALDIDDEYALDGEVGKRLNHMVSVTHVPKINGEIPSADEQISDHQRLLDRLQLYGLVERKVQGDGNCQFRSLSDQLYRSSEHHKFVREQIVDQLQTHLELYEGYVPMAYSDYLRKMSRSGEWGDHVTLQAASDSYGVKIFVITSFKDTCVIEILPHVQKSTRVICLSFWAEVHYNSIYPEGEMPVDIKKKKKWWKL